MPLINCPECNKEISDSVKSCPSCGFSVSKHLKTQKANEKELSPKKHLSRKIVYGATVIVVLSLIIISVIGLKNTTVVRAKIDAIGSVNSDSESKIIDAENAFSELDFYSKIFVVNWFTLNQARQKFDKLPIPLTASNYSKYITFDVSFSNFTSDSASLGYGYMWYHGKTDYTVRATNLKNYKFNNVVIKLKCNLKNSLMAEKWKINELIMTFSENGESTVTSTASDESIFVSISPPSLEGVEIISVSGSLSK